MSGGPGKTKATAQEKALAGNAVHRFNEHRANFVPMEDSFIASLKASDGQRDMHVGEAISDVQQAMKGKDQAVVNASKGQAGQGKSVMARADLSRKTGAARADVEAGTDANLRTREMKGLTKMAAFGRGLQDMNSVSLGDAASTSTSNALSKLDTKVKGNAATVSALGTFAGTAMSMGGVVESMSDQIAEKYGKKKGGSVT